MLSTSRDSEGHGKTCLKGLDALWVKHSFVWTSRFPWLIAVEEDGKVQHPGLHYLRLIPPRGPLQEDWGKTETEGNRRKRCDSNKDAVKVSQTVQNFKISIKKGHDGVS